MLWNSSVSDRYSPAHNSSIDDTTSMQFALNLTTIRNVSICPLINFLSSHHELRTQVPMKMYLQVSREICANVCFYYMNNDALK